MRAGVRCSGLLRRSAPRNDKSVRHCGRSEAIQALSFVLLMLALLFSPMAHAQGAWDADIAKFEAEEARTPPPKNGILFLGSSSIVRWDVGNSFPDLPAINRGFGGSLYQDLVTYFDRIVPPYRPSIVVLYSGDNDTSMNRRPAEIAAAVRTFEQRLHALLPNTKLIVMSTKPSPARWRVVAQVRQTNELIRAYAADRPNTVFVDVFPAMLGANGMPRPEFYIADGLHLTPAAYALWTEILRPHLQ